MGRKVSVSILRYQDGESDSYDIYVEEEYIGSAEGRDAAILKLLSHFNVDLKEDLKELN